MDSVGSVLGMTEVCKVVKCRHCYTEGETVSCEGKEAMGVKLGVGLNPEEPEMAPMAQRAHRRIFEEGIIIIGSLGSL